MADGYARLSYRQTDTLWKRYTPAWDLHHLRHTAISARAHGYSEVELKRFSGIYPCATSRSTLPTIERPPSGKRAPGSEVISESDHLLYADRDDATRY
jgi:hypothetical protein